MPNWTRYAWLFLNCLGEILCSNPSKKHLICGWFFYELILNFSKHPNAIFKISVGMMTNDRGCNFDNTDKATLSYSKQNTKTRVVVEGLVRYWWGRIKRQHCGGWGTHVLLNN
jgi:hypothetical protein